LYYVKTKNLTKKYLRRGVVNMVVNIPHN